MNRYVVRVDVERGIRNDPKLWSEDPQYVVDLVSRVVRVSVETVRIAGARPTIEK
ncbi:MAG: hypothetical protein ACHQFZ_10765 [Acidimicrobiales bacterium]